MPEYTLRNLDPRLWSQFTERATREGWRPRPLIVSLMEGYAQGDFTPSQSPARELPEFAWLRAHYREIAQRADFSSLDSTAQWRRLRDHVSGPPSGMAYRALEEVPLDRRPSILAWLGRSCHVPTAAGLTLRAIAHIIEGADRRPFQFEVLGLPPGQQAWIADFDGGWRILRAMSS